jgi:hypothetical protein
VASREAGNGIRVHGNSAADRADLIRWNASSMVEHGSAHWSTREPDASLGIAIVEYTDDGLSLAIHVDGLRLETEGRVQQWAFLELVDVRLPSPVELGRAKYDKEPFWPFWIVWEGGEQEILVPPAVYGLSITLLRAVRKARDTRVPDAGL